MSSSVLLFPSLTYQCDFTVPGTMRRLAGSERELDLKSFSRIRHFVNDKQIAGLFGSEIEPLLADWLELAVAVYLADRASLRGAAVQSQLNCWKRLIKIKLAVRRIDVWSSEQIQSSLAELLNFFTDDEWVFEFVELDSTVRDAKTQGKLPLPPQQPPRVALYSGGLDSFAGAAQQISADTEHSFILVSGATHNTQKARQRKQVRGLRQLSKSKETIHLTASFGIKHSQSDAVEEESSQRTRGFLFLTLGAIAALYAGVSVLEVYENGIGAINLPYNATQVGTMNSRSVHPLGLMRMEYFVEKLTQKNFQIVNPFLFQTKGEMCKHSAVQNSAEIISLTFSCDKYPIQTAGKPQCGFCTSCQLRRLSLEAADLSEFDDGDRYLTNLSDASSIFPPRHLNNLKAMEWQYQEIKHCLAQEDPWQSFSAQYPMIQLIVSELQIYKGKDMTKLQNGVLRLYKQYCLEWEQFSARRNYIPSNAKAAKSLPLLR